MLPGLMKRRDVEGGPSRGGIQCIFSWRGSVLSTDVPRAMVMLEGEPHNNSTRCASWAAPAPSQEAHGTGRGYELTRS